MIENQTSDASEKPAQPNAYLDTVARIEPDIAMLDTGAALASIAISLRRIADVLSAPVVKIYDVYKDELRPISQEDADKFQSIVQELAKRFPEDLALITMKLRAEGKLK